MEVSNERGETVQGMRSLGPIVMRRIAELTPYARNARTHSPEQIAQIARSIVEFGFTNPVLVDRDGGIIAGHGRVLGAASLDMGEVPTLDVHWLTPAQRRAYVIADNQLALNAGWDNALLAGELGDLQVDGFGLEVLGFADDALAALLEDTGATADAKARTAARPFTYQEKFSLLIECKDEPEQAALFERLAGLGIACKVLVN